MGMEYKKMKYSTKFWLWAGSCFASFIMGMQLEEFSLNQNLNLNAKIQEFKTTDNRRAITLSVPTTKDKDLYEGENYTFLEQAPGKYLTCLGLVDHLAKGAPKPATLNTLIANEFVDTNTNGLYDTYRLVIESGTERKVIQEISLGTELNKREVISNYPPRKNQRFLPF
jgi:hypothetical protein